MKNQNTQIQIQSLTRNWVIVEKAMEILNILTQITGCVEAKSSNFAKFKTLNDVLATLSDPDAWDEYYRSCSLSARRYLQAIALLGALCYYEKVDYDLCLKYYTDLGWFIISRSALSFINLAPEKTSDMIQVCVVTTVAGMLKGRPDSIRRKLYRVLESVSWWTPLGWVMDLMTCNEAMQKLQAIAEEFAKETNGKQLFYLTTVMMSYKDLEKLMQYSKEPTNQEIAKRLKKILEAHKRTSAILNSQ